MGKLAGMCYSQASFIIEYIWTLIHSKAKGLGIIDVSREVSMISSMVLGGLSGRYANIESLRAELVPPSTSSTLRMQVRGEKTRGFVAKSRNRSDQMDRRFFSSLL